MLHGDGLISNLSDDDESWWRARKLSDPKIAFATVVKKGTSSLPILVKFYLGEVVIWDAILNFQMTRKCSARMVASSRRWMAR